MKAYVITTGVIFGLITVAHLLRFVAEGSRLVTEPVFILLTVLSAALCVWAWLVLRRLSR
jgi:predicted Co/Zn/Cd cation transporter (cation efflux family)